MERESITFYCGVSHGFWSYHRAEPGPLICISPIVGDGSGKFRPTGVYVPDGTLVLQDSGAYGEPLSAFSRRLTFAYALKRQEQHAEKYNYSDKIAYRASYDLLVDHRMIAEKGSSVRKIVRCNGITGIEAVDITVRAAKFIDKHRSGYHLALNAQGSTPIQYFQCVQKIMPLFQDGDVLGLGGCCIIGRKPSMMHDFLEMLSLVIPFAASEGVKRVHLYGSIYTPALSACLAICDHHGIAMSTDSAFPSFAPRLGKWGYGSWRRSKYSRPPVLPSCKTQSCELGTNCLGLKCIEHIKLTREWLSNFRERESERYQFYARNLDQYCLGQVLDLDLEDV
ncbi:MAG TPA: hypothetical protein VGL94_03640 [Ktedonobacteraceae bacterium]|jgi:hypothetical protein